MTTSPKYLEENSEAILKRLQEIVPDLQKYLNVSRQAVSRARSKSVPLTWVVKIGLEYGISTDWLIKGTGPREDFERLAAMTFPWSSKAEAWPVHSADRANYIFEQGCGDENFPGTFIGDGSDIDELRQYLNGDLDDFGLYTAARAWARDKISRILKMGAKD